jgi:hypothetical protein
MFGVLARHRIHMSIQIFVTLLRLPLQGEIFFH